MRRSLVGFVGTLTGSVTARHLALSSSSGCQMASRSPLFSSTTSARLISTSAAAAAGTTTSEAAAFQKLRLANSAGTPWLVLPHQALEQQRQKQQQGLGDLDGDHCGIVTDNHCVVGLLDIESGTSVPVPVPQNAQEELLNWSWIGSSQGWLILGDLKTNFLCLFNPIPIDSLYEDSTKSFPSSIVRIPLPDTYPRELPTRVFLTSPPPSDSHSRRSGVKCQVFAVYKTCVAFCSLNADSNSSPRWSLLTPLKNGGSSSGENAFHGAAQYEDVFLDGRWLVTTSSGEENVYVEEWDLDHDLGPKVHSNDFWGFGKSKLASSHEESTPNLVRKMYLVRGSPSGQPLEHKDDDADDDGRCDMLLVMRYVASHVAEDGTPFGMYDVPQKMLDKLRHKTVAFDVHRALYDQGITRWESVELLGDRALFLGGNQPLAIPVAAGEGSGPIKSNCIYFSDDYYGHGKKDSTGGHDCGVFDMADQTIRSLHHHCDFAKLNTRPIWLLPTLQP